MATIFDVLSWVSIVIGVGLVLTGGIGMLRLPDVFARMHGAGLIDTMGLTMILLGLGFQAGLNIVTIKLILILVFVLFTSPTTTHALARAALSDGLKPILGTLPEPSSESADLGQSDKKGA